LVFIKSSDLLKNLFQGGAMRRELLRITTLALMLLPVASWSQTRQPCSILRVIDGQRIELRSGAMIRLAGLQALPNFSSNRFQIFAFLDSLLIGQSIEVEFDEGLPESCGYLWRDTLLINVELLRRGWLQVWDDTARFKYRDIFLAAQNAARQNKFGGWKSAASVDSVSLIEDDTVYVTKSGKKYHRAGCRLLSQNKIALPLAQARGDHEACRLCEKAAPSAKTLLAQPENKTAPTRCLGKTKSGERCKRDAEAEAKYCWQHRRKKILRE
jgi:endonuclease YncB( thermonuclease family)